jgi:HK97 gp10 family phage protein
MSVEASFKIEGFEDLFAIMKEISEEIGKGKTDKVWREMLKAAMTPVLEDAKREAPKNTGQLADNIYLRVHRPMRRDKEGKNYIPGEVYMARVTASTIRDDTRYDLILNKRGRFQTVTRNKKPVPVSQEFGNAQVGPGHPFLLPAMRKNYGRMEKIMTEQLIRFIASYDRSKGIKR